jgi:hypothetical protein
VACLASVDGIFDIPHTILFAILLGGEILLLRIFQAGGVGRGRCGGADGGGAAAEGPMGGGGAAADGAGGGGKRI